MRSARKGSVFWTDVKKDFKKIVNSEDYDERVDKVRDYVNKPDLYYDREVWVDEAVKDREGEEIEASDNFGNTHWYKFQMAAKDHLVAVMEMLKRY